MATPKKQLPDVGFVPLRSPESNPVFIYDGFNPSTTKLPVGHTKEPGLRPFEVEVTWDKDVAVKMRDGVTLYTDVFRPTCSTDAAGIPAMIVWSPYGKAGGFASHAVMGPENCGVPVDAVSGYQKFEGPCPADWCKRGYAIVNIDARGVGDSEGNMVFWGEEEAQDMYDTISWASKQAWCNGSVTFAGNSWLAIAQLNLASRYSHPALKCIAPWEGATDAYRDTLVRGGIPHGTFFGQLAQLTAGRGGMEDIAGAVEKHPLLDDYWANKIAHVENISVPMYVVASYSTGLHSRGSFDAFIKAKTSEKWLRVHAAQEWSDQYIPEHVDELQRFYDYYCKGSPNDWKSTPKLRLSLLGFEGSPVKTIVERPEDGYPVPNTEYRKFFLEASDGTMSLSPRSAGSEASYEAHHLTDCADFSFTFDEYTEIAGYPVVKLWMSCKEHDDMDVVVQIRKLSREGNPMVHLNYPCSVPEPQVLSTNVSKHLGPEGMLRASHRLSKEIVDGRPWYRHDKINKIPPGDIVSLEIALWPIGMVFDAGEGFLLRVAGHDLRFPETDQMVLETPIDQNIGRHRVHTGKVWDSHIVIPIVSGKRA